MTSPLNIPLNLIYDNPYQAREHYSDIQTLADSIRNVGLLHSPIGRMVDVNGRLITDVGDIIDYDVFDQGGRVQIAFGHRRLRAFRVLNETGNLLWHSMPVVLTTNLSAAGPESDLARHVGPRAWSRLMQMSPRGFIVSLWNVPDYRMIAGGRA